MAFTAPRAPPNRGQDAPSRSLLFPAQFIALKIKHNLSFATRKWSVLAKDVGRTGYMEWSNESKEIFFDTLEVPEPAFYRMRISDSHLQTIVSISGIHPFYGSFGPWTGVTPDGSPLLVRDISNEEIYSLDLQLP